MAKLLMISGDRSLAEGRRGAFYNTLEEFRKYWDRIDIICPKAQPSSRAQVEGNPKSNLRPELRSRKVQNRQPFSNVFIHPSPWPLMLQPFWILKEGLRIYKENKFDLTTVHEYPPFYNGIGSYFLWRKIRIPYWIEVHHIVGYPKAADFKEFFYRWLTRVFIKFDAQKAIAVRIVNKKQVLDFLIRAGVSVNKIIYLPSLYIDLDIFKPLNLKKEYDAIFVGRLEENKGADLFIGAMAQLKTSRFYRGSATESGQSPELKTLIVGDGPLLTSLKFKVKNLKLENQIIFHGWAEDSSKIAKLMNKSMVLIMPSYNEGGPRVVLEAMACGVPILATNVGLIPDLADKGVVKIIEWDAEDIAQKTKELLENEDERNRLNRIGIEIAKQFEKKEAIKNYAEKLQSLI